MGMSGSLSRTSVRSLLRRGRRRVAPPRIDRPEPAPAPAHGAQVTAAIGRRRLVVLLASLLYLFGLVMVTSATSGTSLLQDGDQWEFLRRQATFGVLGMVLMFAAMRFPLTALRRLSWPLLVLSIALSALVFIPGLSHTANGATRWIRLGAFQLQPSEIVKIAVVVYVADHLSRTMPPVHWLRDFLKSPGGVGLGAAALVFVQKDLGTAMVIGGVVLILYMLAGTSWRLLAQVVGPGIALVVLGILSEQYRRERFLAFIDPWAQPHGTGYQLVQALIAIGSGGIFGVGLGHSVQKIHFLPEAHTDMIFSIVAEELGLVGVAIVLLGFISIAVVGTRIAMRAQDRFNALLAAGLTAMLCVQAILNLGGVVGALPLTGVPLPLISYGGSNLLVSLMSLGLLANIACVGVTREHIKSNAAGSAHEPTNTTSSQGRRRGRGHDRASGTRARSL